MTDPTVPDNADRTVRCRLSDGYAHAVEFSAQNATTLAAGCRRAFDRYVAQRGGSARTRATVRLELQVRPIHRADERAGWYAPVRPLAGHPDAPGAPVIVTVSDDLLERRPPDDWTEIWSWVQRSRAGDRALGAFVDDVHALEDDDA